MKLALRAPEMTLGARLYMARRQAKLDQADIGRQLGVSRATISTWERDVHEPSIQQVKDWARITGIEPGYLFGIASVDPGSATVVHSPFDQRLFDPDQFDTTHLLAS